MSCECGVDCSEKVSMITFDGTLTLEHTGMIHPSWDNSEFDCLEKQAKVTYDFVKNSGVTVSQVKVKDIRTCETNCEINGKRLAICEGMSCLTQVTYETNVSWSDFEKLANLGMSYDQWLALVKVS